MKIGKIGKKDRRFFVRVDVRNLNQIFDTRVAAERYALAVQGRHPGAVVTIWEKRSSVESK